MRQENVSLAVLLMAGIKLAQGCTNTWPAAAGDTCASLASDWGITLDQFNQYNPSVDCSKPLVEGQDYCVADTDAPPPPKTTTTSTMARGPTTTDPLHPQPTQDGIVSNCNRFYKLEAGTYCQDIVDKYGGSFTLQDFYKWNPAVGDCQYLLQGYFYCVGVPGTPTSRPQTTSDAHSPRQTGTVSNCQRWYKAKSGDTCPAIAQMFGTFSVSEFESWNPAVGSTCNTLYADYWYCVGIPGTPTSAPPPGPSPTQDGITKSCNSYYKVKAGDTCQVIVQKYKITLANFYKWNPAVKSDCSALWAGYNVCVGVKA